MRLLLRVTASDQDGGCDTAFVEIDKPMADALLAKITAFQAVKAQDRELAFWEYHHCAAEFLTDLGAGYGPTDSPDYDRRDALYEKILEDGVVEAPEDWICDFDDPATREEFVERTECDYLHVCEDSIFWQSCERHSNRLLETAPISEVLLRKISDVPIPAIALDDLESILRSDTSCIASKDVPILMATIREVVAGNQSVPTPTTPRQIVPTTRSVVDVLRVELLNTMISDKLDEAIDRIHAAATKVTPEVFFEETPAAVVKAEDLLGLLGEAAAPLRCPKDSSDVVVVLNSQEPRDKDVIEYTLECCSCGHTFCHIESS